MPKVKEPKVPVDVRRGIARRSLTEGQRVIAEGKPGRFLYVEGYRAVVHLDEKHKDPVTGLEVGDIYCNLEDLVIPEKKDD